MTKELFHGRSHPKYQKIEIYDTLQDMLMPRDVRNLNDKYVSITTSGHPCGRRDFDFVLEEKNRQLKSWIPKVFQMMVYGKLFVETTLFSRK